MSTAIAKFKPHPDISFDRTLPGYKTWYKYNYSEIFQQIKDKKLNDRDTFAHLIKDDLFVIVHFVMGIEKANHPFVVQQCRMVEEGPMTGTVDVWAREHFKSTVITIALTVKRIVNNPECCTAIFSYKKGASDKFLDAIRKVLELPIMVWAFPQILYENPTTQSPSWSLQGGIRVKRQSTSRKEHTVEAFGLIEGMPTGVHADHRIYDDVETDDLAQNPEQMSRLFDAFEMSRNLGTDGGTEQVIGTYYSHHGLLVKLGEKKNIHGEDMYLQRLIPATDNGTITGDPVFFSQEYLDSKKMDRTFNSQQLCNPTPTTEQRLYFDRFKKIKKADLPSRRAKIIVIDTAGDAAVAIGKKNDNWAMLCLSVDLGGKDDLGLSNIYIEDGIVSKLSISAAVDAACRLYMRNSVVSVIGIEQAGQSTQYNDIRNGLMARGVYIDVKGSGTPYGNMILLSPGNKSKETRIENNISWSLNNGKLHIVEDSLDQEIITGLQNECERFPFFHVDILDALAYLFNILADKSVTLLPCRSEVSSMRTTERDRPSPMCA